MLHTFPHTGAAAAAFFGIVVTSFLILTFAEAAPTLKSIAIKPKTSALSERLHQEEEASYDTPSGTTVTV